MMKRIPLAAVLALGLAACGSSTRSYYRLEYPESPKRFEQPRSETLHVRDLDIGSTYRGTEIVYRPDVHQIQYYRSSRWSEKPQAMISNLLRSHLRQSGLFTEVTDAYSQTLPTYTLQGQIESLEELQVGPEDRQARIAISFRLLRTSDDQTLWHWKFDARRPVSGESMLGTVRTMSDLLDDEFTALERELDAYLKDPEAYNQAQAEMQAKAQSGKAQGEDNDSEGEGDHGSSEPLQWDPESPFNRHPSVLKDDTPMPVGYGAVIIPSLSPTLAEGDREPLVVVYRGDKVLQEGRMGKRIILKPGEYKLRMGSGAYEQQLEFDVQITEGRTVVVPPTAYASLEIDVLDEVFVPHRGSYEIIRLDNREDYGVGFGADEQQGEEVKIWILPPGLYKIIRSGGNYRDRVDFATVRLLPGEHIHYSLVTDPTTGEFKGAGEMNPEDIAQADKAWKLNGVLGGEVTFNRNELLGQKDGWNMGATLYFDGSARYLDGPHLWLTRLELEEGQQRPSNGKHFQNIADRLYLHSIYTYNLLSWFGPYTRVGAEAKLLPRYIEFDEKTDVEELDKDGNVVKTHRQKDRIALGSLFAPLQLKEGAGGNFHVLRERRIELDFRVGIGGRHTLSNGLLAYENNQLVPVQDNNLWGVEGTVVGLGRLGRFMTLSTEFDGLLPFNDDAATFTWRNQASLRLASFLSLVYRLNLTRDPNLGIGDDVKSEHDVQLRFSYTLF